MGVVTSDCAPSQVAREAEEMKKMGADPEIYAKLVTSLSPSIYELDDVRASGPLHYGLSSIKLALITSDCDAMRIHEHRMALITSDCVP